MYMFTFFLCATQRRGQSRDVTFAIERFCVGVTDSRSTLGDSWMGVAYIEATNPGMGAWFES